MPDCGWIPGMFAQGWGLGSQPTGSNFKEPETCPALPSLAKPEQQRPETKPDLPLTPSGLSILLRYPCLLQIHGQSLLP